MNRGQVEAFSLFATDVHHVAIEGIEPLNAELARLLLAERERDPGIRRSNVEAWHSRPDLARRPEPAFRALCELVRDHVEIVLARLAAAAGHEVPAHRWRIQAWSLVMDDGGYAELHDHAHAHWSTAWYVDAGDADPERHPRSGHITFVDPRRAALPVPGVPIRPSTFTVRPRSGSLLVFPGYLQHYVHPYRGRRPRIVVAANLLYEPLEPADRPAGATPGP